MTASRSTGLPSWLIVIAVMTGIGPFTIDLYLPAFPMIEAAFGEGGVEGTMASYLIGLACGQLLYGPISDRFGRKPPLYVGFAIYIVGSLCCAFADSMHSLMIGRVVQALGACAGMTIGRAIVRDRCQPEEAARVFSTLMSIVSIAPILAPIAGGFVVSWWGWRATFFIQAGLGALVLTGVHFYLNESLDAKLARSIKPTDVLRSYWALFGDKQFMAYSVIGGFAMAALFGYVAGAPMVLPTMFDVPPETFGWLIGINGLAFMTASRMNTLALRKLTPNQVLARYIAWPSIAGLAIIAAGMVDRTLIGVPLIVVLSLQFSFFILTARLLPNCSALALAPRSRDAGTASALLGAIQSFASMITGVAVTVFNDGSLFTLGIVMTASVLICALVYARLSHRGPGTAAS
jgi:DHA1 family bicyclomycin/chloramphenicol resistance-like MFS transporter